jgi:histone acetyltransferase (RNA polymerase elongator complex component)
MASAIQFLYEANMKNYIIPIFIPHYGCPHTCVFCNQRKITGIQTDVTQEFIQNTIEYHLNRIQGNKFIEVAFYGGSFTALPLSLQIKLLEPAYLYVQAKKINSLRISTRPDCITNDILDNLAVFGVETIELGAQSFDDVILAQSERGHTVTDIIRAAELVRAHGFHLGIQLMPGLPGDTWQTIMASLSHTIALCPDFVRIYPTLVLIQTQLAQLYKNGDYQPLTLQKAIQYATLMKLTFIRHDIKVIRIGLQASKQLDDGETILAGPYHPAFGELVDSYLFKIQIDQLLERLPSQYGEIILHHHPKDTSKVRGNKNCNLVSWYKEYHLKNVILKQDLEILNHIIVEFQNIKYSLNSDLLVMI